MDAVRAIRNRRAEMNVPPSKKAKVLILTEKKDTFSAGAGFFPKLAYASEIELIDAVPADAAKMASVVTGDAQIYMPMGDLIDFEAERARLGKEKSKVEADIDFVMKKLNNPKFVDKAPEKVVAAEREKAEKLREHLAKLEESDCSAELNIRQHRTIKAAAPCAGSGRTAAVLCGNFVS